MRGRTLALLTALAASLAGCGGSGGTSGSIALPVPAPTIADPLDYLAPAVMPEQPVTAFRFDVGRYQAEYAQRLPDGSAELTWSYPPFGPFVAANGDGGERYVVEGDTVRIDSTQDGGKPGVQYFTGAGCGGTGWVAFRTDATAGWQSLVAALSDQPDPRNCATGSSAFSRYQRTTVDFLKLGTLDTIVSEHYDRADTAAATGMERAFYAKGYGRLVWQAWAKSPPSDPNLAARCPDFDGWNKPPSPGWYLSDCREALDSEPPPAPLVGGQLWHP